jgi:hypothetical protein
MNITLFKTVEKGNYLGFDKIQIVESRLSKIVFIGDMSNSEYKFSSECFDYEYVCIGDDKTFFVVLPYDAEILFECYEVR